jgi:hypothetical protein
MKVMELALFKLKPEVTEDQLQAALQETNGWLARQPGFVRRHHGTSDEGRMDLVEWESLAAAKTAADQFMAAAEASSFMTMIDTDTIVMRHFHMLQ